MAVTFRLLNRFQNSWYLRCLARAEKHENGIDNCVPQFLIGERVPGVLVDFFEAGVSYLAKYGMPIFQQKKTKRPAPENLSEIEARNYRCHFRAFQLELHIVDAKNFEYRFSRRKVTVNSASAYSKCRCTLKLQCEDWHLRSVIHTQ